MEKLAHGNTDSLQDYVLSKLEEQAASDEQLFESISNENKTVEGMIAYIQETAKKEYQKLAGNKNGVLGVSKDTVVGWAIHYFTEKEVESTPMNLSSEKSDVKINSMAVIYKTPKTKEKVVKSKPVKSEKKSKLQFTQLSLFDDDGVL